MVSSSIYYGDNEIVIETTGAFGNVETTKTTIDDKEQIDIADEFDSASIGGDGIVNLGCKHSYPIKNFVRRFYTILLGREVEGGGLNFRTQSLKEIRKNCCSRLVGGTTGV